ncbi:AAR2 family protein [Fonsecaea pedrosoi]|nr:AAR2 family protein [Fonsecaea pedrosoi]
MLIILSLPPKTFVGLDLVSFNSSPNFHGIAKIPWGFHFLYTGTDASLSIRHGRWLNLNSTNPIQVLRWNRDGESLQVVDQNDPGARNAIAAVSDGRGLVDYAALQSATSELSAGESKGRDTSEAAAAAAADDEDGRAESTDWPALTTYVSSSLLTRILSPDWIISSISSAPSDTETIPGLSHLEASNALDQLPLDLLPVNLKQTWAGGDIGRARTDRARDRSWYLGQLIEQAAHGAGGDRAQGARELLGELQFCFLMVLTLANYSCLEQWKRLLTVFFTCRTALDEAEGYFVQVVRVLRLQIMHVDDVEGGLFELRDESGSAWLRTLWARFRAVVDDVDKDQRDSLRREVDGLERLFEEKYGWQSERDTLRRGMFELEDGERVEVTMHGVDEDEETGEYAPVIVET